MMPRTALLPTASLPQRIRAARMARGLSQTALAERAELSNLTLSRWEIGTKAPSLASLNRVARVLDVAAADLLDPAREQAPAGATPSLGANIRAARMAAAMTPAQLAPLVGAPSGRSIEKWEDGTSEPMLPMIERVASVLGLRLRDLLLGPGPDGYPPPKLGGASGARQRPPTTMQRTLAARLRAARLARHITAAELAAALGQPLAHVRLWETRGTATVQEVTKAARVLKVSADYLLGLQPHPTLRLRRRSGGR